MYFAPRAAAVPTLGLLLGLALGSGLSALPATAQSGNATAAAGEKVFRKCRSCHRIGPGARNATGPVLTGVLGRGAGSYPGYGYSRSMAAAGAAGLVWDAESVFEYLADPTAFLRSILDDPRARAKMRFRLKKDADRRAVIAYLATFPATGSRPASSAGPDKATPAGNGGNGGKGGKGGSGAHDGAPANGFCIVNASDRPHFFAVETREGARQLTTLGPGERLCSAPTAASDGVVSVFESDQGFEGCSRIVPTGTAEEMRAYAEFDRCLWSSQDG